MKRNSLTTAVVAGIAGVAGFAGLANAVDLNPDGLGQVLIYPYYTVNKNQDSLFTVVNTTGIGKAVKVRFLESDGLIQAPTDLEGHGKDFASGFDVPLQISGNTTAAKLAGDVELVVCDVETHSVCVPLKRRMEVTFGVQKGAAPGTVRLPLPQAKRG